METKIQLLKISDLTKKMGLSRSKIYELVKSGEFHIPIKVGRCSLWVESEVDQWIQNKINQRV